jgi:hypothetical protein
MPTPSAAAAMIRQILTTAIEEDGIVFDADSVHADEIRENREYGGIRVTFTARLNKARLHIQADIGFGDAITPAANICGDHSRTQADNARFRPRQTRRFPGLSKTLRGMCTN